MLILLPIIQMAIFVAIVRFISGDLTIIDVITGILSVISFALLATPFGAFAILAGLPGTVLGCSLYFLLPRKSFLRMIIWGKA